MSNSKKLLNSFKIQAPALTFAVLSQNSGMVTTVEVEILLWFSKIKLS